MANKPSATLRIPLVWTSGRRLRRGAVFVVLAVVPLAGLTLPLLWLDAVLWLIALAAVQVAVFLVVRWRLIRTERSDIQKNGPFIEIGQGLVRFPPGLAEKHGLPGSVPVADLEVHAWSTQTTYSNGHGYYAETGYLDLVGGGIDLLLATGNQTGVLSRWEKVRSDISRQRVRDRTAVAVDGKELVTAAQFFAILREKRAAARSVADAAGTATATLSESAHVKATDRLARAMSAMANGAKVRAARAIAAAADPVPGTATETPTEANVTEWLLLGRLRHVPPDLVDHVRNWRDGYGSSLLHELGSNRALDALLEAGLDLQSRDAEGRTVLMVFGRTPEANRRLIAAGAPLTALCRQGHNAVWHQLAPAGIGFVVPDFAGVEALITAGLPPPTRAEANALKETGAKAITSGTEHHGWVAYCKWLDRAARDQASELGGPDSRPR